MPKLSLRNRYHRVALVEFTVQNETEKLGVKATYCIPYVGPNKIKPLSTKECCPAVSEDVKFDPSNPVQLPICLSSKWKALAGDENVPIAEIKYEEHATYILELTFPGGTGLDGLEKVTLKADFSPAEKTDWRTDEHKDKNREDEVGWMHASCSLHRTGRAVEELVTGAYLITYIEKCTKNEWESKYRERGCVFQDPRNFLQ